MLLTGNLSYYLISHFFLQISAFNGSHTFAMFILVLLKILLDIFFIFPLPYRLLQGVVFFPCICDFFQLYCYD